MTDNLKTRYSYNEDDFVQNGEELKELTVTITLCEYRNLIRELSTYDAKIESLQEENKKIKEQLRGFTEIIVHKSPEIGYMKIPQNTLIDVDDIKKVIYSILGAKEETEQSLKEREQNDR